MRDYYQQFLAKYSGNTLFDEPTKPTKDPSARSVGSESSEFSKNPVIGVPDRMQHQHPARNEIFEERIAIMMYDGGLSEAEAIQYLSANPEYTADFYG